MSRNGLQDASVWRCICDRQVPARFEECHCGVTREQALRVAKANQPAPRKPLTLLGLSLRLGAVAAVIVVGVAVYLVYFPTIPPPSPVLPSATPTVGALPSPVASAAPVASMPAWSGNLPAPPLPTDIPPRVPDPAPETVPSEEPSDLDKLKARAALWRGRYQLVVARIADLQKEVAGLEADVLRAGSIPYEDNNPGKNAEIRRRSDFFKERLAAAREALAAAREELSQIEEGARQEGIPSGQLY